MSNMEDDRNLPPDELGEPELREHQKHHGGHKDYGTGHPAASSPITEEPEADEYAGSSPITEAP